MADDDLEKGAWQRSRQEVIAVFAEDGTQQAEVPGFIQRWLLVGKTSA